MPITNSKMQLLSSVSLFLVALYLDLVSTQESPGVQRIPIGPNRPIGAIRGQPFGPNGTESGSTSVERPAAPSMRDVNFRVSKSDDVTPPPTRSDQFNLVTRQTRATTKRQSDEDTTKASESVDDSEETEKPAKKKHQRTQIEGPDEEDDEELERERERARERAKRKKLKQRLEEMERELAKTRKDDQRSDTEEHGDVNRHQNRTSANKTMSQVNPGEIATANLTGTIDLDPRSPSVQANVTPKKIMGIFNDSRGKPAKPVTVVTSPATNLPYKFSTRKPFLNESNSKLNGSLSNQKNVLANVIDLDWSKLVKVVFKAGKDNETLYTVIVNSSELSNHPINDWSTEIPQLLSRDFDRLVQKWSNILPPDHLLLDLARIIASKASASPVSKNLAKLNETLAVKNNGSLIEMIFTLDPHSEYGAILKPLRDLAEHTNMTIPILQGSSAPTLDSKNNSFTESSPKSMSTIPFPNTLSTPQPPSDRNHSSSFKLNAATTGTKKPIDTHSNVLNTSDGDSRPYSDIVKEMSAEHVKIEGDVKEQAQSLRYFIIICSVSIVIGTSLVVAIVLKLYKR